MSETHIIQVRDLVEELQRHPHDAEVVTKFGPLLGARYLVDNRRRVELQCSGSEEMYELQDSLESTEKDCRSANLLLERFDKIMSEHDDNESKLTELHADVTTHLNL